MHYTQVDMISLMPSMYSRGIGNPTWIFPPLLHLMDHRKLSNILALYLLISPFLLAVALEDFTPHVGQSQDDNALKVEDMDEIEGDDISTWESLTIALKELDLGGKKCTSKLCGLSLYDSGKNGENVYMRDNVFILKHHYIDAILLPERI
ncbi:hypothetical protein RJZ90_005059 [Blastomyces dermatitidis]